MLIMIRTLLPSFIHSATSHIQGYQVRDISTGGQCMLNVTCTVHDRAVATGCEFVYDSNEDGTLDVEVLINVPMMGNIAESRVIIDCNLNQLDFIIRAVVGTTLSSPRIPLDCPVSDSSFDPVSIRGKLYFILSLFTYCCS